MSGAGTPGGPDRALAPARRAALAAAGTGCLIAVATVVLCWWSEGLTALILVAAWNVAPFALLWLALGRILTRPAGWLAAAAGFAVMTAAQAYVLFGAAVQLLLWRGIAVAGALAEPLYPLTLLYAPLATIILGLATLAIAVMVDSGRPART